jgi:uncharacterized protein (DUF1697 family)
MPTYVAMLRGINVGGQKKIKMDRLREAFEALGFEQVKTYVQSGNVIFTAKSGSPLLLSKKVEEQILKDFGFPVSVILRTSHEMGQTIRNNPFMKEKGIDLSKLHVTFLASCPDKAVVQKLDALVAGPDQFRYSGKEVYLYCPDGYGRTKLSNNALERVLSVGATTRNWRTANELFALSLERG